MGHKCDYCDYYCHDSSREDCPVCGTVYVMRCDCCGQIVPEEAYRLREKHPIEPSYIVTLKGHERHWLTL